MSGDKNPVALLGELLKEAGLVPKIGLRAQGHMPTIKRLLSEGKTWEEIGRVIGWEPKTAERWYRDESALDQALQAEYDRGKAEGEAALAEVQQLLDAHQVVDESHANDEPLTVKERIEALIAQHDEETEDSESDLTDARKVVGEQLARLAAIDAALASALPVGAPDSAPAEDRVKWLAGEVERLIKALEAVEWVVDALGLHVCPWCYGTEPSFWGELPEGLRAHYKRGHKPDCRRQAALAAGKGAA
jgi:hypothetical protein